MSSLRLGMAQINCTVGDLEGNTAKIKHYVEQSADQGVDVICFPELAITGYPPEDLLFKSQFIKRNLDCVDELARCSKQREQVIVVGFVDCCQQNIYNAAAVIHRGAVIGVYHKFHLPNYGVFDEQRYFKGGSRLPLFNIQGIGVGVNICEDIWFEDSPIRRQVQDGAQIIINISASPYHMSKWKERQQLLSRRARENGVWIAYNNLVGGQDELVFDGHGMLVNPQGEVIASGRQFEEELIVADIKPPPAGKDYPWPNAGHIVVYPPAESSTKPPLVRHNPQLLSQEAEIYQALMLGLKDYVAKNGFSRVVVGLSGGIDSALTAVIASDALGSENVELVFMPSKYSSETSCRDAQQLAHNLGAHFSDIPIQEIFSHYLKLLKEPFAGLPPDIAEENLQARIRGNLLMALSNKHGWLVLATGNKSEISVGYATIYGDMVGGFAVLKDVPKLLVYKLSEYRNQTEHKDIIPRSILEKAPSAELRHDQRDTDSLPPYDILDPIIEAYVEKDLDVNQIQALGYDESTISRIIKMIDRSEYKRRQAPLGIKITPRAFGKDRRMPVTNRFNHL
jgi:NAD+ synthase (glutamine-hydrolysing)